MKLGTLDRMVEQARLLPGEKADGGLPRTADREAPGAPIVVAEPLEPAALRRRVGALLLALGQRIDEALPRTLELAGSAWDQVDTLTVVDVVLRDEIRTVRQAARALAVDEDAARRAIGLEAELTLDAAVGLVSLLERRLSTLVRLRMRSDDPQLLPEGRPFVDLGAALGEAARAWV
jgi:hypothetical protein